MIYFIQSGEDGPVKIGKARNPKERLAMLQTGSPERLHLRAVLDEPDDVEKGLHRVLDYFRMKGEWFRPDIATNCVMACAMAGHVYAPNCRGDGRLAMQALVERPEAGSIPARPAKSKFDRNAYQRELMRKRRANGL